MAEEKMFADPIDFAEHYNRKPLSPPHGDWAKWLEDPCTKMALWYIEHQMETRVAMLRTHLRNDLLTNLFSAGAPKAGKETE